MKSKDRYCSSCLARIPWFVHRDEFHRLRAAGLDDQAIRTVLPRCSRCVSRWLDEHRQPVKLPGCRHWDPTGWEHRDGAAWCVSCGRWMGRVRAASNTTSQSTLDT